MITRLHPDCSPWADAARPSPRAGARVGERQVADQTSTRVRRGGGTDERSVRDQGRGRGAGLGNGHHQTRRRAAQGDPVQRRSGRGSSAGPITATSRGPSASASVTARAQPAACGAWAAIAAACPRARSASSRCRPDPVRADQVSSTPAAALVPEGVAPSVGSCARPRPPRAAVEWAIDGIGRGVAEAGCRLVPELLDHGLDQAGHRVVPTLFAGHGGEREQALGHVGVVLEHSGRRAHRRRRGRPGAAGRRPGGRRATGSRPPRRRRRGPAGRPARRSRPERRWPDRSRPRRPCRRGPAAGRSARRGQQLASRAAAHAMPVVRLPREQLQGRAAVLERAGLGDAAQLGHPCAVLRRRAPRPARPASRRRSAPSTPWPSAVAVSASRLAASPPSGVPSTRTIQSQVSTATRRPSSAPVSRHRCR